MRKLEKLAKYIIILVITLLLLLIIDVFLVLVISKETNADKAYVSVERIAKCLNKDGDGQYSLTEDGIKKIDSYKGFAMLIDDSGKVIWEYNMPSELPREYGLREIAAFTRWYLQDYPVYIHIIKDGIFVVGRQKHTVWKYVVMYTLDTIEAYKQYVPIIFLSNIVVIILIPVLLLRRDLRKKEQMRTTWIAGISHDIRTPLALVLGDAGYLRQSLEKNASESVERAKRIEEQVIRIRTLITNLNTDNKLTFGMGKWKREEILFCALLREVLCNMINREPGEQYEFNIRIDEEAEGFLVYGDRELLTRMLENLIGNAIYHNPKGCCIEIAFQKDKRLIISDNGCGVTKEQLKNFKKPLFMDTLAEHGLGIRLVRRIAKLHHFKVQFEPNGSSGLCCQITMGKVWWFL